MNISNMNNIESRVQSYWTKRAHNFNIVRKNELNSSISERWREEIVHFLPEGKVLQILDVGTGTGYFAILLSQIGHQVTGIDLTDAMLKEACDNAALYQVHPTFQQMDAQKLAFLDQSFDVVISRNLTWTLPDAEHAYQEWFRVLKPGGQLLVGFRTVPAPCRAFVNLLHPEADDELSKPRTRTRTIEMMREAGLTQITWQSVDLLHSVGIAWKPL